MPDELLLQAAKAAAYYAGLLVLVRLAGKRMAGQTTTFDLIILIALGVVLQTLRCRTAQANAVVFVLTVFALHRMTAMLCAHSRFVGMSCAASRGRWFATGTSSRRALELEGITHAELLAGLRKLGYDRPDDVKLAVLEETGHISAVGQRQRRRPVVNASATARVVHYFVCGYADV